MQEKINELWLQINTKGTELKELWSKRSNIEVKYWKDKTPIHNGKGAAGGCEYCVINKSIKLLQEERATLLDKLIALNDNNNCDNNDL